MSPKSMYPKKKGQKTRPEVNPDAPLPGEEKIYQGEIDTIHNEIVEIRKEIEAAKQYHKRVLEDANQTEKRIHDLEDRIDRLENVREILEGIGVSDKDQGSS